MTLGNIAHLIHGISDNCQDGVMVSHRRSPALPVDQEYFFFQMHQNYTCGFKAQL